jgi:hypothetical protein
VAELKPAPAPSLEPPAAAPFDWSAAAVPPPVSVPPPAAAPPETAAPIALTPGEMPPPVFSPAAEAPGGPPTPMPAPPATLSFGAPQPAAAPQPMPSFGEPAAAEANAQSTQEVLARLAKPAPEPPTAAPRPKRSNKTFLIAGGVLVAAMGVIGFFTLRHPKDLNQMAELDDGRAKVGYAPVEEPAAPPMVKPQPVAPPPAPAEAPQPAPPSKLDQAVAMVKDFPLDGDRGTVAAWLQFSYTASPDAGQESWSGSETSDKTYLVEYRFTPSKPGSPEVHYLFEVDMDNGLVIGKNLDAKSMLAGGPRPSAEEAKPKPKPKRRKPARRKAVRRVVKPVEVVPPKEVPLLPLPEEGELRPPAEDDGAFRSDTVNSGL